MLQVKTKEFDISIHLVRALLTSDGVQYGDVITNKTTSYKDLFSIDSDAYFPFMIGNLARSHVVIWFEVKGGNNTPVVTYKADARNKGGTWTIMSAEESYSTTVNYVERKLEGDLKITSGLVDTAPLSVRLQFKSNGTTDDDLVSVKLRNDTVIRFVGTYSLHI